MKDKFLCVLATFDDATSNKIKEIERAIKHIGITGTQTPNIPHHITLGYFDIEEEEEIKLFLRGIVTKKAIFDLNFSHIGLFGLKVLFLAPDVNSELLDLHNCIGDKEEGSWTAHTTLLIDEEENIKKALEVVASNFKQINSRVVSLALYEFFPARYIGEYKLQRDN